MLFSQLYPIVGKTNPWRKVTQCPCSWMTQMKNTQTPCLILCIPQAGWEPGCEWCMSVRCRFSKSGWWVYQWLGPCGMLALKITYCFLSKKDIQLLQEEILPFHHKFGSLSADSNLKIRVPICLVLHLYAATVSTHVLSLCDTHLHHLVCSGLGM